MPTKTMKRKPRPEAAAQSGIGDEAVRRATGLSWAQWFRALDSARAQTMSHREIVAVIGQRDPELGGWWRQMITVAYEQARGLRRKHEKADGFQVGASRTIGVPLDRLYRSWAVARSRQRWLPDKGLVVRKATPGRSMRITWNDGRSSVNVEFASLGDGRSRVSVEHGKLSGAREAERMKAYWRERLGALKEILETAP